MNAFFQNVGRIALSLGRPLQTSTFSGVTPARASDGADAERTLAPVMKGGRATSAQNQSPSAPPVGPLALDGMTISPAFKLLLILTFVLILVLILAIALIAVYGSPANAQLQNLSSSLVTLLTAAVGAVLGLFGGKAVS